MTVGSDASGLGRREAGPRFAAARCRAFARLLTGPVKPLLALAISMAFASASVGDAAADKESHSPKTKAKASIETPSGLSADTTCAGEGVPSLVGAPGLPYASGLLTAPAPLRSPAAGLAEEQLARREPGLARLSLDLAAPAAQAVLPSQDTFRDSQRRMSAPRYVPVGQPGAARNGGDSPSMGTLGLPLTGALPPAQDKEGRVPTPDRTMPMVWTESLDDARELSAETEETWGLQRGATLRTRYESLFHDDPEDRLRGRTSTEAVHSLTLAMGEGTQLVATFDSRAEQSAGQTGRPAERRLRNAVKFSTDMGSGERHSLVLSMSSDRQESGERSQSRGMREAHLSLAPAAALSLHADYAMETSSGGQRQTIGGVGTVLRLAGETELRLSSQSTSSEGGSSSRETTTRLNSALGGGSSQATVAAERTVVRSEDGGSVTKLKCALTGSVGRGANRLNLTATLREDRGDGASGLLSSYSALHLDRALTPRLRLTVDHEERTRQVEGKSVSVVDADYRVEADLSGNTVASAALTWVTRQNDPPRQVRELCVEHEMGKVSVQAYHQLWPEDGGSSSVSSISVDVPTGRLPTWASSISRFREFTDDGQYLSTEDVRWEDIDFAGYRVAATRRSRGIDDGLDGLTLAHRRVVANRYHLRLLFQRCPESDQGLDTGRPVPVNRGLVEVGTPLRENLFALARLTREPSIERPDWGGRGLSLRLAGSLSAQERVQASVSRESEHWEEKASDLTRVTLMYSRRVDDERSASVKLGYAWGTENSTQDMHEYRFTVAYRNPI